MVADEVVGASSTDGAATAVDTAAGEARDTRHLAGAAPDPSLLDVGEDTSPDWLEAASGGAVEDVQAATPSDHPQPSNS